MKNYCKTLLFLCCFTLVAGVSQAQVKFGGKLGYTASNLIGFEKFYNSFVEERDHITTEMKFNYHVGVSLDLSAGKLFLRPELELSSQGFAAKLKSESGNSATEAENYDLYYIKLPAHIGYKHALNMDTDILFGIGGYASYLFSGNKDNLFKELDYGLSSIVACDYVQWSYSLSYEFGLVDMIGLNGWNDYRKNNQLSAVRNSCIKISVARYF